MLANAKPDKEFIELAVGAADVNALRLALYQQTGDPELAAMKVSSELRQGNPFKYTNVEKEHHDRIREMAVEYLSGDVDAPVIPTREEANALMDLFCGRTLSEAEKGYAYGDLAFDETVRFPQWKNRPPQEELDKINVTIIGAGFSGLLAGIQMDRLGINYRIIERQSGLGGTWWLNDYLEARVDVTSFLYQYKFELGYPWKSFFATQGELQEYIDYIVDKYDLRKRITLGTKVNTANWIEDENKWRFTLEGPDGQTEVIESNFCISASGQFSTPQMPKIDGIEDFQGAMFHSTEWDHDYDLTGKRVAIIGTGSTGSQMTRGIAEKASSLTIYQRTPNWIMKMPGYRDKVPEHLHWLMDNMPGYRNWFVFSEHISQLRMDGINEVDEEWVANGGLFNERNDQLREILKRYIYKSVGEDKELYEKLVPDYAPLARRPVVDNDWYKTLTLDHVDLVAGPIDHFTETGIVAADGSEKDFDLVVLCAGFQVERFLWPVDYIGRDGSNLDDLWKVDGPRAYQTSMLPGFPNFAMIYGPNSGLVAGSYHSWIELFTKYFCEIITHTIETGASSFELRREAYDAFNKELDERSSTWVYQIENGGGGYYMNKHGRSSVRLPWKVPEFYDKIKQPKFDDYLIG